MFTAGTGITCETTADGTVTITNTVTDTTNDVVDDTSPQLGGDLDCNGSQIQWSQGADVASATALAVLTDGNYFDVTGTTAITSINTTGGVGTLIKLHFDGALTLTHDATDLILPGGANITTAAGDEAEFIEYATGDYRCTNYSKASGEAVIPGSYTLPEADATTKGGIELFSDTDQSVAAESVSTTANRTYGLQLNSDGQGVINVPWSDTDTNTTYSAGDFKLDDLGAPDDNTDLDFSTSAHGLVPKGTNTGNFLKDDGTWAASSGGASVLGDLTDVSMDITNFTDGLLIQPNSDGSAPTTGTLSTATGNVGIGKDVFAALTSGDYNEAYGYGALARVTTGYYNTAVGYLTGEDITTGYSNVCLGYGAGKSITVGYQNTFVGSFAGQASTGWNPGNVQNTGMGAGCFQQMTSATNNVGLGYRAGYEVTSGSNLTLLGSAAGQAASPSGSITTGGNIVCIGNNSVANLYCADTSISSSDQRDKTDIENFTAGLSFVNQMRPVTYRWDKRSWYVGDDATSQDILDTVPDGTHKKTKQNIGFLSQEIEVLEKEIGFATSKDNQLFCNMNEDDTAMGLKYERLVPVLVNAIQELSAKVEALENA